MRPHRVRGSRKIPIRRTDLDSLPFFRQKTFFDLHIGMVRSGGPYALGCQHSPRRSVRKPGQCRRNRRQINGSEGSTISAEFTTAVVPSTNKVTARRTARPELERRRMLEVSEVALDTRKSTILRWKADVMNGARGVATSCCPTRHGSGMRNSSRPLLPVPALRRVRLNALTEYRFDLLRREGLLQAGAQPVFPYLARTGSVE